MNKLFLKNVCIEDQEDLADEDMMVKLDCFHKGCARKTFYAKVVYKTREVTCPNCNSKYRTKCFKNGKVSMIRK